MKNIFALLLLSAEAMLSVSGRIIVIDNILFGSDQAVINGTGEEILKRVAEFLAENPRSTAELSGHADTSEGQRIAKDKAQYYFK